MKHLATRRKCRSAKLRLKVRCHFAERSPKARESLYLTCVWIYNIHPFSSKDAVCCARVTSNGRKIPRAIPKSTSDWLVKKIQNTEQNFIIWNSYIHNCITSPHSCHPHLGTCCTGTLVFVVSRQKTVPPSYAASCRLHPWALRWCGTNQTILKRW